MAKRDYYEILGVSRTASADEIKKAHRKLVRKLHPDVNRNNPKASEQFSEVQEAYDVLSEPGKRQKYDQFGHAGPGMGGGGGADPFEAFRRAQASQRGGGGSRRGATVEDFDFGGFGGGGGGESVDFSSVFEQMFGGGGGRGARSGRSRGHQAAQRGADVEHPVTLTFAQAARGVTLPLQISRGGKIETIDVKIPPGVKDGSRVRIKGRGQQSAGGEGDLYIVTTVHPHPYFRREGLDIYMDLHISLYEALQGAKIDVPTLDGPITLTIPPGTSSGAKLRIRERGVFRGADKGDQFVVTKIIVPKSLDAESTELIKKLQAANPVDARSDLKW